MNRKLCEPSLGLIKWRWPDKISSLDVFDFTYIKGVDKRDDDEKREREVPEKLRVSLSFPLSSSPSDWRLFTLFFDSFDLFVKVIFN